MTLDSKYNGEVENGNIVKYSILHVTRCHVESENNVVHIIDVEVEAKKLEMIGKPVLWEAGMKYASESSDDSSSDLVDKNGDSASPIQRQSG